MNQEELRELLRGDVLAGARALLGCRLVSPAGAGIIVETEAYRGLDDPGCHAFGKARMKNMALFGPPGRAYVYLSYGVHWMLNVSAGDEDEAAGVLIRALRPDPPGAFPEGTLRGPGKLARALGVTPALNGRDLLSLETLIHLEPREEAISILTGPRVGLSAGKGEATPWRFVSAADLSWVSRPLKSLIQPSTEHNVQ